MGGHDRRWDEGEEEDVDRRDEWRPTPGKITSTSLIGAPNPPRHTVSPGKRPLTLGLARRSAQAAQAPQATQTPQAIETPAAIARSESRPGAPPSRVPEPVVAALSSERGQPLADGDRWSERIGADVSHAHLVTGDRAAAAAASIDARAFTVGDRVFFGAGHGPESGGDLLRHELTHVAQQRGAALPSSPASLPFTSPGDHAEVEARGGSAAGTAAAPTASIARDTEADVDAATYRQRFAGPIGFGVARFLGMQTFSTGSPYVTFASPAGFAAGVVAVLGTGADLTARLDDLLAPNPVATLLDKGRVKGREAVSHGGDDVRMEDKGNAGPSRWFPDVSVELGIALAARLHESLARIVPRYLDARLAAGVAEEERARESRAEAPQPLAADIVPSHPIDRVTIEALIGGASFAFGSYRADHPDARGKKGQLRAVSFTWEPARARTYWLRVTSPADPTTEEVAAALFGSPSASAEIAVSAAPLFGLDSVSRLLPVHKERLQALGVDTQRIGNAVEEGATGPLADEIGRNQASAAAGAPGATDVAPPKAISREEVLRTLGEAVVILQKIRELGQTFGMGKNPAVPDLADAVKRIDDRRAELLRGTEAQALSWGDHARQQKQVLTRISFGFAGVVERFQAMTRYVQDATVKRGGFNLPPHVREALNACASLYVDAARISHLPASAEAVLAAAESRARLLPIEILEGTLASIQRTVDDARKNKRSEGGDHASYDVEGLNRREEGLRLRLGRLRTTLLQDPVAAAQDIEEIQQEIADLQLETEMVGNMDQLDAAWQAVVDTADPWFMGPGTMVELEVLKREGQDWHARWKAIHAKWKRGDKASRDQARADLDVLRRNPGLPAYFGKLLKATKSARLEAAIGKIVALLVITIVTMGVGDIVLGVAGAYELGTGATILAVSGAEAITFTALTQLALDKDHTAGHVAWEFASNWAMFGVMRRFALFAEATKLSTAGAMTGQAVILGAMTLAKGEIDKYARTGKHLTKEEMAQIALEGLVMWVALNAAGRYARPILKELEGFGHTLGTKVRAANKAGDGLKTMAEALQGQKDPAKALAYIQKERAWLEAKRDAYAELERVAAEEAKNPPADGGVLKKSGLTLDQVQSLRAEMSAHADKMKAAQRMLQLEAIAPDVYTCPREQIPQVVADLGDPVRVVTDPAGGAKTYEFKGPDGKTVKIIEKVNPHEEWLGKLRAGLTAEETAKLEQMTRGKSPREIHELFQGNLEAAKTRIQAAVAKGQALAQANAASKTRAAELKQLIQDEKLMKDPEIQELLAKVTDENADSIALAIRGKLAVEIAARSAEAKFPGAEVLRDVKVYVEQPETSTTEWLANHPDHQGVITTADGHVQLLSTDIDVLVIERQSSGKARVLHREEVKSGHGDRPSEAKGQLEKAGRRLDEGATGAAKIRLEHRGKDITEEIDMASAKSSTGVTRGPAGKGFDTDLGIKADDLTRLIGELMAFEQTARGSSAGDPPHEGGGQ